MSGLGSHPLPAPPAAPRPDGRTATISGDQLDPPIAGEVIDMFFLDGRWYVGLENL